MNTPERGTPGWAEATAFTNSLIVDRPLVIQSYRDRRSFERWVCDVWVDGISLAGLIVEAGHGVAA